MGYNFSYVCVVCVIHSTIATKYTHNHDHRDLNDSNQFVQSLALTAVANIASEDICRDLSFDVEKLLQHSAYVRKKAALCAVRIIAKCPEVSVNYSPCRVVLHSIIIIIIIIKSNVCMRACVCVCVCAVACRELCGEDRAASAGEEPRCAVDHSDTRDRDCENKQEVETASQEDDPHSCQDSQGSPGELIRIGTRYPWHCRSLPTVCDLASAESARQGESKG